MKRFAVLAVVLVLGVGFGSLASGPCGVEFALVGGGLDPVIGETQIGATLSCGPLFLVPGLSAGLVEGRSVVGAYGAITAPLRNGVIFPLAEYKFLAGTSTNIRYEEGSIRIPWSICSDAAMYLGLRTSVLAEDEDYVNYSRSVGFSLGSAYAFDITPPCRGYPQQFRFWGEIGITSTKPPCAHPILGLHIRFGIAFRTF
jgi:hypothetical protein